jgi:hypothetical protein
VCAKSVQALGANNQTINCLNKYNRHTCQSTLSNELPFHATALTGVTRWLQLQLTSRQPNLITITLLMTHSDHKETSCASLVFQVALDQIQLQIGTYSIGALGSQFCGRSVPEIHVYASPYKSSQTFSLGSLQVETKSSLESLQVATKVTLSPHKY